MHVMSTRARPCIVLKDIASGFPFFPVATHALCDHPSRVFAVVQHPAGSAIPTLRCSTTTEYGNFHYKGFRQSAMHPDQPKPHHFATSCFSQ